MIIYHITTQSDWKSKENEFEFFPTDYSREGFIHCCTKQQLNGVLERYFQGRTNLVLLHLNEESLKAELKYELATDNEKFPHLYGGINRDAIVKAESIR